jgi:hypothetical protein
MTTANQDIDDGLTEEERAALVDEEGDTETVADPKPADAEAAAEAAAGAEDKAAEDAAAAATAAAAAAAAGAAEPAAADAAAATTEAPQSAPILVAPPLEDAAAKLAELDTKKEALLTQFDDGDITAREYQKQLDALAKEERSIERAQDRAELAAQMDQQRLQNDWNATCNAFVATHDVYKDNPRLYKALDAEVRELASKPETAQWTGQQFLDEAHKNLKTAFGFTEAAGTTPQADKQQRQQRDLPPNLAKVPAANVEDTNGGRFAVLDRMANSDPVGYEETLAKMSEAERTAYLNA